MASRCSDEKLKELLRKVDDKDEELEEEHLPFLFRTLHSLAPKWYGFCLQLGVKELDQIQRNGTSVDDCFVLALQSWLHNGVSCNWKQLITAIFKPAGGGNQRLACDVAESFRGMYTPTCIEQARTTSTAQILDSYSDVESAVQDIQSMLGAKVAPRWYQMGVTLGTRVADLEAIRLSKLPAQDSEKMMLDAWLKNTDMTTWQWLVDAVGHSAGGNYQRLAKTLAKKIAAKLAESAGDETTTGRIVSGHATPNPKPTSSVADADKVQQRERPNLLTLLGFPTSEGYKNLAREIGPAYKIFGTFLLSDKSGAIMAGLERRHNDRVEDINVDVFQKWVTESKSPVTWEGFVKTLRKAGLNHLAVLVESGLTS